jgi:endogenous inhibitor of DNA gyrase (YacG/DUF329 family)
MPVCSKCGTSTPSKTVISTQDNSTYVCDKCQNLVNLDVWKDELKNIEKMHDRNPSQERRIEFLKKKIAEVEQG